MNSLTSEGALVTSFKQAILSPTNRECISKARYAIILSLKFVWAEIEEVIGGCPVRGLLLYQRGRLAYLFYSGSGRTG